MRLINLILTNIIYTINYIVHKLPTRQILLCVFHMIKRFYGISTSFHEALLIKKHVIYYFISFKVATRWYRAPELLYCASKYDEGVDLWAVGCIFGELLNKSPLFAGDTDIEQLSLVIRALGTPNEKIWPSLKSESRLEILIQSLLMRPKRSKASLPSLITTKAASKST